MQVLAPDEEYDPAGQNEHDEVPLLISYWPAVQLEHPLAPMLAKLPAPHMEQPVAPVLPW